MCSSPNLEIGLLFSSMAVSNFGDCSRGGRILQRMPFSEMEGAVEDGRGKDILDCSSTARRGQQGFTEVMVNEPISGEKQEEEAGSRQVTRADGEGQQSPAEKEMQLVAKKAKKGTVEKEMEPVHIADDGYNGEPRVGLAFRTPEDVFHYYENYARCAGFGIKIFSSRYFKDGICRYLVLSCNRDGDVKYKVDYHMTKETFKTNCLARICMMRRNDGLLHITKVISEHNHPLTPGRAKSFHSRRRKNHIAVCDDVGMTAEEKLQTKQHGENKCSLRFAAEDGEVINQFLVDMQTKNSGFFHSVDLDAEGHLKNVFWADGWSRLSYHYFGDVVLFNTCFLINQYDVPLVSVVGVNHHGQPVLLGCGLVSDDTVETYRWLFKTWLSCMLGRPPTAVITDRSKAVQEPVAEVLPRSRQRQCLWHIMERTRHNLRDLEGYKEFEKSFKKVVFDSLRTHDFEEDWQKLLQNFGLEENEWLRPLFEDRQSWAPAFVKDSFWAGMSVTLFGDSMQSFFKEFIDHKTVLQQFLTNFQKIVQNSREKEIQADYESFHKNPQLITQLYMEQQLATTHTINMFKRFQDELKSSTYCTPSLMRIDGSSSIFLVIEHGRAEDGRTVEQRSYEVFYNGNELEAGCICCLFQFKGVLCRHLLSVLCYQNAVEIPSKFIHDRWRKNFKQIHPLDCFSDEVETDDLLKQHEKFRSRCLKLAELGMLSDQKYKLAVKVVNEAVQKLLADDRSREGPQAESASSVDMRNFHMVSFSMKENRYLESGNIFPMRRQVVNHSQFQIFQDRE